jgi:hypothetical protein
VTILEVHRAALERAISPDRLGTYQYEAVRSGRDELVLYIWDRDVSAAAMADIAIVEVAMRNSMNDALAKIAGQSDWYARDVGLDNRSLDAVAKAWSEVPALRRTPGRVVAQLMFGFWRNLLEAGGDAGRGPLKRSVDYEQLWRAGLSTAFPGGRAVAASRGERFTRTWTLNVVKNVHALRNRAAHHEPLLNGIPLPGEKRRISIADGHRSILELAELLDRDLAAWLALNGHLASAITSEPSR